jgi:hypothetical protein
MTTSRATDDNEALVLAGTKGVFIDRDPTVLDRLFSDDYRQHNPQIPNGTAAIKSLLGNLSRDFRIETRSRGGGWRVRHRSWSLRRMGTEAHGCG